MGATSEVAICNSALRKLGAEPIQSLTDDSTRARLCNGSYPFKRKELLRGHPWKFAKKRVQLSSLASDPLFGYDHQFQLPSDCLRVLEVNLPLQAEWTTEQDKLLANTDPIQILYAADVSDTQKFDDVFVEALSWAIAADIAYTITQSTSQVELAEAKLEQVLNQARSFNAQEGSAPRVQAEAWLRRRRS